MIWGNELIALVLALGVLLFLLPYRRELRRIPFSGLLVLAFVCHFLGLVFTVAEGLFWFGLLNLLEHVANTVGVILLVAWLWLISRRKGKGLWTA